MRTITFEEISEGRLSIKLIVHNDDGTETWYDHTLDNEVEPWPNEEIAIYDSVTGVYDRFKNFTAARTAYQSHVEYLKSLIPAVPEWIINIEKKLNRPVSSRPLILERRRI